MQNICKGISSDQGPFLSAIKVNFCPSKILILVVDGSTGLMKVNTPCHVLNGSLKLV